MGTKNQPGKFDCYKNAMPDEPMFTLLARDPSAPALVEQWGRIREAAIRAGERPESDEGAVAEAYGCATDMAAWRAANEGVWRNPGTINYNERLIKILQDHLSGKLLNGEINALAEELQNEWLTPVKFMSCTATAPCHMPNCQLCKQQKKGNK